MPKIAGVAAADMSLQWTPLVESADIAQVPVAGKVHIPNLQHNHTLLGVFLLHDCSKVREAFAEPRLGQLLLCASVFSLLPHQAPHLCMVHLGALWNLYMERKPCSVCKGLRALLKMLR